MSFRRPGVGPEPPAGRRGLRRLSLSPAPQRGSEPGGRRAGLRSALGRRRHGFTGLVLAVLIAGTGEAGADDTLETFAAILASSREGRHAEAAKTLEDLSPVQLRKGIDRLVAAAKKRKAAAGPATSVAPTAASFTPQDLGALALVHLDVISALMVREDRLGAERYALLAERLAAGVAEPRDFPRDFALLESALFRSLYDATRSAAPLDRALIKKPGDPELLLARAVIHETLGALDSTGVGARRRMRPLTLQEETDLIAAEGIYREILRQAPQRTDIGLRLGRTRFLLGKKDDALENLASVLEASPDPAAKCLAHLFSGAVEESRGNAERSLAHYTAAQGVSPRMAAFAISAVHQAAGRRADAAQALEIAITDAGSQAEPWWSYHLGGYGEDARYAERLSQAREALRE